MLNIIRCLLLSIKKFYYYDVKLLLLIWNLNKFRDLLVRIKFSKKNVIDNKCWINNLYVCG